jgi:SSS family solute:Na+ symporter
MQEQIQQVALKYPDYIVIALYMLVLLGIGLYYRKFAQEGLENFFLGGRNLPGWLNGFSYAATCINADVAPAYCGMTVITGVFVCWWYIGRFGMALMIGAVLFALFWRRLKIFTSPEFYEFRFSGMPATTMRTWVAMRSAFIAVVAWSGAGLLGMHKIAFPLLGWEKWETFAIVIPVMMVYVLLSGYVGVVITDFIQSLIIISASLVLMVAVLIDFKGPGGLYTSMINTFGPSVTTWIPPRSHELLGVVGVLSWIIGKSIGAGGDVAPMDGAMEGQRILSCRNVREASKMYIWTEVILFLMLVTLTLPALGAMVKWPGLHDGSINKEMAYGMLLGRYLPAGFLGLAIIGILASLMSTISANLNFGSQVFLNDVYMRFIAKDKPMKHYMRIGQIVIFAIMGLAIWVATTAQNVIDISVFMLGLASAEITANWGQWWWWRFNGKARLAASFGGPVIFMINNFLTFKYIIHISDPTYVVVLSSIAMTFVLWVCVALFTRPDPEEKLVEFYLRARPLGWWGPIALKATGSIPVNRRRPIMVGLFVAMIGAMMVGSGVICISNMYIGQWWIVVMSAFVCGCTGLIFKIMYPKFMNFLEQNETDKQELLKKKENVAAMPEN